MVQRRSELTLCHEGGLGLAREPGSNTVGSERGCQGTDITMIQVRLTWHIAHVEQANIDTILYQPL